MTIFIILYFLLFLVFVSYFIDITLVKNYKIVKFSDNSYGLRRGYYWFTYKDLKSKFDFWWNKSDGWFLDCQGTLEQVREAKLRLTNVT